MNIFVIMPFANEFDSVYQKLIKKPLEEKNHVINRADDVSSHQSIPKTIIQNISNADLVIADLTAQNPNVYYELGISHTLNKPTIHIIQDFDDLGFDIKSYNAIKYSRLFDEAPELTNKILEIIERAEQGAYNFSNPVSDSLGENMPQSEESSPSDIKKGNDGFLEDGGEATQDDSTPGFLDSIVLAEESVDEIGNVIQDLIDPMNVLSERARSHGVQFVELNENPNQKGLNSKRLQLARKFAADLNEFAESVADKLPRLKNSWNTLDQGIGHVLTVSEIQGDDDIDEISKLIEATSTMRESMSGSATELENMRNAQTKIRGLSKASDRAIAHSNRTLEKLLDEFRLGDSVMARIEVLATEMIDRYNANRLDNG